MTKWLPVLLWGVGCAGASGTADAYGAWADGQAIQFEGEARVTKAPTGRVELWATAEGRPRFLGVRIAYDPARIDRPGVYSVDPAAEGRIELYCLRPVEAAGSPRQETVAYEVSRATIVIDALPGAGGHDFAGSFRDVVLERMGAPILTLTHGSYRAKLGE